MKGYRFSVYVQNEQTSNEIERMCSEFDVNQSELFTALLWGTLALSDEDRAKLMNAGKQKALEFFLSARDESRRARREARSVVRIRPDVT